MTALLWLLFFAVVALSVFAVICAVRGLTWLAGHRARKKAMPKAERAHLSRRDQRAWRDLSAQLRADSKRADRGTR
jgi:uncharacterized membrane protein